jgi:Metallo-peptidase family M12/IPT/TIG domain
MQDSRRRLSRAGAGSWPALSLRSLAASLLLILAAGAALPRPLAAAVIDLPLARAAGPGQRVKAPDLASEAELVRFEDGLLPALLQVRPGERVRIADWPVGPGARREVTITRHEVYAPGARVLRVDAAGTHELPRSRLVFFWGQATDEPTSGIYVAVDPVTRTVEALARTEAAGEQQLRPLVAGKPGLHLLATPEAFLAGQGIRTKPTWTCAQEQLTAGGMISSAAADAAPAGAAASAATASGAAATADRASAQQVNRFLGFTNSAEPAAPALAASAAPELAGPISGPITVSAGGYNQATVAIDTDHQLLSLKFSDNTTTATNYIVSMFAQINVMYERDLAVQLLVGTTILRVGAGSDPYVQPSSGYASASQLGEFSNYWYANYGNVSRTVAAMLSGKGSASSASGIAWVGGLCSTSHGYSFSQPVLADYLSIDALIVGHEIGHNFGSVHTHCYSPPIDQCYNLEGGCWSGPESCPAPSTINGAPAVGTIMGYCHLLGGCSTSMVFHPRTVQVISPNISGALGVCMTAGNLPRSVTGISPATGPSTGGTAVVISGSNFQNGDTVTIGGVAATSVNVSGPGTITAVTGAHPTGAVDVVVGGNLGAAGTLGRAFFYSPPPRASGFYTVAPCRVLDTRNATGPLGGPALLPSQSRIFTIAGTCGIPAAAVAISANLTIVAHGGGYLATFPGNAFALGTSNLDFSGGQVRASESVLMLASDGTGTLGVVNASGLPNDFILDVNGYYQ